MYDDWKAEEPDPDYGMRGVYVPPTYTPPPPEQQPAPEDQDPENVGF